MNPLLIKNYVAGAAIAANRIVKYGSADGTVIQGAAATDAIFGVCEQPGGVATGDRVDVIEVGVANVEFGGTVTRGALVTADAAGKAVAAAPATGVNNRILGIAKVSAVSGDISPVLISQSSMQGA